MTDELFARSVARSVRPLPTLHPNCGRCGLFHNCRSPKMKVWGRGKKGILICSDYPGNKEDDAGHAFAGGAGWHLEKALREFGCELERDCWSTNAQICHDTNKVEPKHVVEDCRPNLLRTIDRLKPTVIVLAGGMALQSLIGHVWKPDPGPLSRWTGRAIPCHKPNVWICVTNNPAYVARDKTEPVTKLQFREHLRVAVELAESGRPWPNGPPNYAKHVEVIKSPAAAAERLKRYTSGIVAYDFESDRLKPDHAEAELVSCSICWNGRETIAFPWHGPVIPEVRRIVADPAIGLIASNLDMEARWTVRKLGVVATNWRHDTMLGAHCLDPRPGGKSKEDGSSIGSGCTGLKMQAFIRLGQPDYAGHLDDYLRGTEPGGNSRNRIREINLDQLLIYNGLDSLLEYMVAEDQAAEFGISL